LDSALGKKCDKYFIEGNHEWRLERYIANKAPELFEITSVPKLFELRRRSWKFTPYHKHVKIGRVIYTHDLGKAGKTAHLEAHSIVHNNIAIGHTHRIGYAVQGNEANRAHVMAMFGWLGDIHAAEYMHLINKRHDWALGFGVGLMKPDGVTFLNPVPIVNNECVVNGNLYSL
jgi:hypothetical protein